MANPLATTSHTESYGDIFREVTSSAKQLLKSEVELIKVELKDLSTQVSSHLSQAILFGAMIIVSIVPLLASAVIALGQYWNDNYALSSLVVGLISMAASFYFGSRAIGKLTSVPVMPASSSSLAEGAEAVQRKTGQVAEAVAGDKNEIH